MRKTQPRRALAACLLACLLALTACAAPAATSSQSTAKPEDSRYQFSCLIEQFTAAPPELDSEWFRAFCEKWNLDIQLTCVPTLDFVDRLSYLLTTDELPAVVMTNNTLMQTGVLTRAMESGMFWDLEPYIADYPDLSSYLGEDALANARVNGKLYGLPRLRPLARNSIIYRKDWADNLGLEPPRTVEELYELIRAFQQDDPDGNGIDDTRGLADCWKSWSNIGWNGIQMLTTIYGGPNGWAFEDGAMRPDFCSEAWLRSLDFFRRLHHDGLLNGDFSVLNAEQRRLAITTGNVGVEFCVMEDIIGLSELLRRTDPKAELAVMPLLSESAEAEPRLNSTTGNNGLLLFNRQGRQGIATEEELRFILSIYNDFCTPEGQDFLLNGLEGVHYVNDVGERRAVTTEGGSSLLAAQQGDFVQLLPVQGYKRIGNEMALVAIVDGEMARRTPWLVQDASAGLLSDTYLAKKKKLDQIVFEASMRYILEEIDETEYWSACDRWREAGGNQVIAEYSQQYSAIHTMEER